MTWPWPVDRRLDLVLEREIDVPPERLWSAWTEPEHLRHWYAPAPWVVMDCEIALRPGGIFRTVMRSPAGDEQSILACYLEVVPSQRLVWTDALHPGYRPAGKSFSTAAVLMEASGRGTKYTALAIHGDPAGRRHHEQMGFNEGGNQVLDQLVAYATSIQTVDGALSDARGKA